MVAQGDTIVRCQADGAIPSLLTASLPDLAGYGLPAEPPEIIGDLGARGLGRLIFVLEEGFCLLIVVFRLVTAKNFQLLVKGVMRLNVFKFLFKWEDYPRQPKSRWARAVMRLTYTQLFVALIVAMPTFFINYLAFRDFISTFRVGIWVYGLAAGVTANFFVENFPHSRIRSRSLAAEIILPIISPIFGTLILGTALLEGGPLIYSYVFGESGSYEYTVESLYRSYRRCGVGFTVEDNWGFLSIGDICFVDPEFWETLSVGDKVTV